MCGGGKGMRRWWGCRDGSRGGRLGSGEGGRRSVGGLVMDMVIWEVWGEVRVRVGEGRTHIGLDVEALVVEHGRGELHHLG